MNYISNNNTIIISHDEFNEELTNEYLEIMSKFNKVIFSNYKVIFNDYKLNDKLFTKKVNKIIFKLNEIGKIISYLRPDIFTTLLSLPAFIKV